MKYHPLTMPCESFSTKKKCVPQTQSHLNESILSTINTGLTFMWANGRHGDQNSVNKTDKKLTSSISRLVREFYWNKDGRQIHFLENMWLVEAILNSKFDITGDGDFQNMPDNYCIMPPKGFYVDDELEVHSILVSHGESYDHERRAIIPHLSEWQRQGGDSEIDWGEAEKIEAKLQKENNEYDPVLDVCIHGKYKNETTFIDRKIRKRDINKVLQENENIEDRVLATIFRLVIGLSVYINAGGTIKDGLPNTKATSFGAIKSTKRLMSIPKKFTTVCLPFSPKQTPKGHIRGFHFRNLRAERYYGGEFANWKRGTRWAFVSPYWVGKKIDAKTV